MQLNIFVVTFFLIQCSNEVLRIAACLATSQQGICNELSIDLTPSLRLQCSHKSRAENCYSVHLQPRPEA